MLRRFWLLFAQACTVCIAVLFVVVTLRPDLVPALAGRLEVGTAPAEPPPPSVASAPRGVGTASYAEAVHHAMPTVVNIYSRKALPARSTVPDDSPLRRFFPGLGEPPGRRATSLGSGVIVSADGYVLTNHHVVDGADDIQLVLNDGRQVTAKIRGTDPDSDLAVLKTDAGSLPAITFGTTEALQVGDVVLAIGNPFGFGNTVTLGIVSALGRNHLGINRFEDFIQTDAAINPGNSGGALVDTAGHLVGINSTIYSQSGGSMGIGFAIPVSLARTVLDQIVRDGEVTRGWLGIEPQSLTRDLAEGLALGRTDGVMIRGLQENGPAQKAGVHLRDVIVEIGGRPTPDVPQLLARIAELPPGSSARVKVWREGKLVDVDVTVARRPKR